MMAERNESLTKITLDKSRPYRVNDADRDAVWVGPGDVEVPIWVAEHWGLVQSSTNVKTELETETGHEVVQTGDEPPTYVETSRNVPVGKGKRP